MTEKKEGIDITIDTVFPVEKHSLYAHWTVYMCAPNSGKRAVIDSGSDFYPLMARRRKLWEATLSLINHIRLTYETNLDDGTQGIEP